MVEKRHGKVGTTTKLALVQIERTPLEAMIDKSMDSKLVKMQVLPG